MISARAARSVVVVAVAGLGFAACEHATSPVSPEASLAAPATQILPSIPAPAPYPASAAVPNEAIVCKDASSPLGSYTFSISASPLLAGDQAATSVTLVPGQCAIVYNRTASVLLTITYVTITEQIPEGALYRVNHVSVTDRQGGRDLPGPSVTLEVNGFHGGLANYYNEGVLPVSAGAGEIRLCKAGQVSGTFNFNVTALGTIASDVITNHVTLAAGSCATVFVRAQAGPVAATVIVTEALAANAETYLKNVTVNGQAVVIVGAGVAVQQDNGPGKVLVFVNANVNAGAGLGLH
jgi:hypothetical protein